MVGRGNIKGGQQGPRRPQFGIRCLFGAAAWRWSLGAVQGLVERKFRTTRPSAAAPSVHGLVDEEQPQKVLSTMQAGRGSTLLQTKAATSTTRTSTSITTKPLLRMKRNVTDEGSLSNCCGGADLQTQDGETQDGETQDGATQDGDGASNEALSTTLKKSTSIRTEKPLLRMIEATESTTPPPRASVGIDDKGKFKCEASCEKVGLRMTVCSGANVLGDLGRVATGASNKLFGRQDTAAPDCTSPQRCSQNSILRSPEDPEGSQNRYCALWRNYDRCHVCALTQGCPTVTDMIVDRAPVEKHDWHFCTQAEQYDAYEGRHIHNTLHHIENVTLPIAFDNAYEWKRGDEEYHFSYKVLRDVFLKNPEKHINFHCTDALRDAACKNTTITKSSGLLIKFDEQLEANPALSQCQIEKEKDKKSPPTVEVTLASECVWEKGFECGREEGPWNVTLSDLCNPQEDALSRAGNWAKSNAEGAIDKMGAGLNAIGQGFSSWTRR